MKTSILCFCAIIFLVLINSCTNKIPTFSEWEVVVENQKFPEGITYNENGYLYSSNCQGNWITRIGSSKVDTFLVSGDSTFSATNGMISYSEGSILACDFGTGSVVKLTSNGSSQTIIDGFEGKRFNSPNDLTIDLNGNLFFTDPKSHGKDILDGRIFHYTFSDDSLILIQSNLAFPNGIGISPVDKKLYVCESAKSRILRFKIDADNTISEKEIFIELPGGDPDGINFDIYGNLYVAHFGGRAIYVISPEGEIINKVETPGKNPSNVEFAGSYKKDFYITEDETNTIYKCRVSIPGHSI